MIRPFIQEANKVQRLVKFTLLEDNKLRVGTLIKDKEYQDGFKIEYQDNTTKVTVAVSNIKELSRL